MDGRVKDALRRRGSRLYSGRAGALRPPPRPGHAPGPAPLRPPPPRPPRSPRGCTQHPRPGPPSPRVCSLRPAPSIPRRSNPHPQPGGATHGSHPSPDAGPTEECAVAGPARCDSLPARPGQAPVARTSPGRVMAEPRPPPSRRPDTQRRACGAEAAVAPFLHIRGSLLGRPSRGSAPADLISHLADRRPSPPWFGPAGEQVSGASLFTPLRDNSHLLDLATHRKC